MSEAIYKQAGNRIDYTPTVAALVEGEVVPLTNRCGVATSPIALNALGSLCIKGVVEVVKATGSGETVAMDAAVYWDGTYATSTSGSGTTFMGFCVLAAGVSDATVLVDLQPLSP